MKANSFPKSSGQRFYEDVIKTVIRLAADFDESQLIELMEYVFTIQCENMKKKGR